MSKIHKPKNIIAIRGEIQVGKVPYAELGGTLTACCATDTKNTSHYSARLELAINDSKTKTLAFDQTIVVVTGQN